MDQRKTDYSYICTPTKIISKQMLLLKS